MSMIEIEIEGPKESMPELTMAEKEALLQELRELMGVDGNKYGEMSVESRNAAIEAVMKKLKGEKED